MELKGSDKNIDLPFELVSIPEIEREFSGRRMAEGNFLAALFTTNNAAGVIVVGWLYREGIVGPRRGYTFLTYSAFIGGVDEIGD